MNNKRRGNRIKLMQAVLKPSRPETIPDYRVWRLVVLSIAHLRFNQYFSVNPCTFQSIHLRFNQSSYVPINQFTFQSIHLCFNQSFLHSNQSIYISINPFTFQSIHLHFNQSIHISINPVTSQSIHLHFNQFIYISIHLRFNQSIYVSINPKVRRPLRGQPAVRVYLVRPLLSPPHSGNQNRHPTPGGGYSNRWPSGNSQKVSFSKWE